MSAEALATINAMLELTNAARKHLAASRNAKDIKLYRKLSQALRTLYFTPSGVIGFLEDIARGSHVPQERVTQALLEFNDRQWGVESALDQLDFYQLSRELGLTIATARKLEGVKHGKASLRRDIQQEINFYGQDGAKPNKKRVVALIKSIQTLNKEIEAVEALVNNQAR